MRVIGLIGEIVLITAHGSCSSGLYCLPNIYYEKKSFKAGIITALRNRLGDVALLFRIA